jgi:hypothetical protein
MSQRRWEAGDCGMVSGVPSEPTSKESVPWREAAVCGLIFLSCFLSFRHAPIQQTGGDDRYSLLLAENLLRHRDFTLERYRLPTPDYRLEDVGEHRYYGFPPGTSVLSIPYVALMHLRGKSVLRGDAYAVQEEMDLETRLAASLMAAFALTAYLTARLLLPVAWSLAVTVASAFGTQVFSTMSRALWSDTWGVFLVGLAAFMLLRSAVRRRPPNLPLLATLEAWAYIVRPTNSLALVGTAVYLLVTMRRAAWPFLATAGAWLALFVVYSWRHFHHLVPSYFEAGRRIDFTIGWSGLLGNLLSPGRGLLIYVPLVPGIALLLLRYRKTIRFPAFVALPVFVICGHLVMLAGFQHWWGGHCFGARLTGGLVPWLSVLAVVGLDALREARARGARSGVLAILGLLSVLSIAINAVGAFSREASSWNVSPNIDETPARLWSWRRPQFAAPFVEPAGPFPALPVGGLLLGSPAAGTYLGLGWSGPEGNARWTDGHRATILFSLEDRRSGAMEIDMRPYLGGGRIAGQHLIVTLNDKAVQSLTVGAPDFETYAISVPADVLLPENRLRFELPDASSPMKEENAGDRRQLGLFVRALRWRAAGT